MTQVPIGPFDAAYRADPDPWRFGESAYEQRRYDVTMACLPEVRYRRAFEPRRSVGEVTARLAQRCDRVVAWDASTTAIARTRQRFAEFEHIDVVVGNVPRQWPTGSFDLIMLSEIGYYFDTSILAVLVEQTVSSLDAGGTLMAVHWTGTSADHILTVTRCTISSSRVATWTIADTCAIQGSGSTGGCADDP